MSRLIDADKLDSYINDKLGNMAEYELFATMIDNQPTVLEEGYELRLLKNYLTKMTKAYRQRTMNWCVVRDLLMSGTSTGGRTSCFAKCRELGIDPWGYYLKGAVKE